MAPTFSRRDLLKLGVFAGAAVALPFERSVFTQQALPPRIPQSDLLDLRFTRPFQHQRVLQPLHRSATTDYYEIRQRVGHAEIVPGLRTEFAGYNGSLPGPLIHVEQGREVVVRQINDLPETHPITTEHAWWTSTHLHGSASLPEYDGYASDITMPRQWKDYRYPNFQNARTLWYHDHGVHHTSQNAYLGLAAQYHLHDPVERSLGIPLDRYDVPVTISDAIVGTDGSLLFDDAGTSRLMGEVVLANGVPWPVMRVERRKYRFRFLNASISRSYRLQLDPIRPVQVIATDGGLMPQPQTVTEWRHGNAERYEVVIDFAQFAIGDSVTLRNLSNPNNVDFASTDSVMRFDVVSEASDLSNNAVPGNLFDGEVMRLTEADAVRTRQFIFDHSSHWTVNGETWDDVIASDFRHVQADPELGDVEIWELQNPKGGWFHPVHVHLIDFKILDRNGQPPRPEERGPKDVAYIGENEIVRVVARFGPQRGRYMMHCHNLVHEDHDMMTQFQVGGPGADPRLADPARDLPAPPLFRDDDSGPSPSSGPGGGSDAGAAGGTGNPRVGKQSLKQRLQLIVRGRFRLEDIRRDGFSFAVDPPPGARVLHVRVMRGDRVVVKRVVSVRPGRLQRVRLPRRPLLRRGNYRLVVRSGRTRDRLGTPVSRAFRIS